PGIDAFDRAIPPYNPDGGTTFGGTCQDYYLARDVKPGKKAEFKIDAAGQRLSWDPDAIPAGFELTLVDGASIIDMASSDGALLSESAKIVARRVLPDRPTLYSAVPNPFNPATTIRFALPEAGEADLAVYDVLGKRISTVASGNFDAGVHAAIWNGMTDDGIEMPSGIYFYRLRCGDSETTITKSMVLLR
ncbi:T9SS type A sorting domain-containing protein, partial [bacterium]|nr:T9SS type A sorting domain-containing protein [bacterium]